MNVGLSAGGAFGDYRVVDRLGKGGMGEVWLLQSASGGQVAAKILDPAMSEGRESRRRFLREAELALGVKHPNLVEVYDVGEDPDTGLCYILMEYVPGGTLADLLKERGALPIDDAVAVVRAMADVLELGRQKGIVHRDIKPANIMFAADGTPKLADLGIARRGIGGTDTTTVTQTGMMIGTPAYMSPEQMLDAHNVDTRADIYSLGIVFFEMLTGERPNKDDTVVQLMAKAVRGDPVPDVRKHRPDVPAPLAKLLKAMAAPDKDERIPTPGHITQALDEIERGDRFPASVGRAWEFARRFATRHLQKKGLLVSLFALAALAAAFALVSRGSKDMPKSRQAAEADPANTAELSDSPENTGGVADVHARTAEDAATAMTDNPPKAAVAISNDTEVAAKDTAPAAIGAKQGEIAESGKRGDVTNATEIHSVPAGTQSRDAIETKATEPPEPQKPADALGTMFPGWKTSPNGGVRAIDRMENYRGVKDVLCAYAAYASANMSFSNDVTVAGAYPVLCLRLANQEGDRHCRLRVKIGGKTIREVSVTDGWTRVYVRLDAWQDKHVHVELEHAAERCVYWSAIKVRDSQLLSERAREQESGPGAKKKTVVKGGGGSVRRNPPQGSTKTCGELFPGWKIAMGEQDYEDTFRGRRGNLISRSATNGGSVVLSRKMTMPSKDQFPKPELKLYVTVATHAGGEFVLQIMANGKTVYGQDILGDSWKPLRCDVSAWGGKDVLLELICMPKGQNRVCAYWNRIEVR